MDRRYLYLPGFTCLLLAIWLILQIFGLGHISV